jgi:hypothetical protein
MSQFCKISDNKLKLSIQTFNIIIKLLKTNREKGIKKWNQKMESKNAEEMKN